jgi:Reprolysin (M12B) family zinc metalloprotease
LIRPGALLNRLNVVDGIFSEQVGVAITATELKVFDDPADPFTTSDAGTLLDLVGRYRKVTPAIAATGLAHLVTGRNLTARDPQNSVDDSIVAIADLFGVCEAEIGVSVSERLDPFISALVAAHEFGHNLGAPHDDEAGSPCQSAPSGFLMEATLIGSSRFTQCSLDQMAPIVAASSCIRPRQYVDVAVELAATRFQGHARVPMPLVFHVVNRGSRTADHAEITVTTPASAIALEPVNVKGGSCTSGSGSITCQMDAIPAGARRRMEIDAKYSRPWT